MNQSLSGELAAVMPAVAETGLLTSLATFQQPDGIFIAPGQPSGNFVDVAVLIGIRCQDAPMSTARIQASEKKALEDIEAARFRHILLAGYFPQIPDGVDHGWRVTVTELLDGNPVDSLVYDLLGAEADSQTRMTRISCRIVNV